MSNIRVIYNDFTNKHHIKIIKYLYEKHGWEPILVLGHDSKEVKQLLPDIFKPFIFKSTTDLRLAQFDYSDIGKPVPIDNQLISSLSNFENNFLALIEDTTNWNYSFFERKSFYYDMLKYWNTVIRNLKPDLFVSFTWPHTSPCYSLYLMCKYYYSIDIQFIDFIPLFNNNYHLIGNSLEELFSPIIKTYNSKKSIRIDPMIKTYLSEIRKKEGKTPKYILKEYKAGQMRLNFETLIRFINNILIEIKKHVFLKSKNNPWKKNRKPYYLSSSRMNGLESYLFHKRLRIKNIKLRKVYEQFTKKPDLNKKYIYFAASYQPEAVTTTNAGAYYDLFLVLDILSSIIPDDWIIYYKEHLYTFLDPLGKGNLRRDKYYFQRVNNYKNVQIISPDISSFSLINMSQAVASVSGTVAWETVVRGKPALSFGSAWYMGCNSIFWIKTLQDAKEAIKKIVNGYTPDQEDIEHYAASAGKVAVKGMIHYQFDKNIQSCKDPEYEMERIATALYNAYKQYYC
jgi:hypothetical protein